nr:hypothetical protein [Streptococcus mitis]
MTGVQTCALPIFPTAEPAETTDIQGKEQTGTPEFKPGNPNVPIEIGRASCWERV